MDLPSDVIHQHSKWLLPAVHLYHPDPGDDFIHGADSVIRQNRRFSPETAGSTAPVVRVANGEKVQTGDGRQTSEWRTGAQKQSVQASE